MQTSHTPKRVPDFSQRLFCLLTRLFMSEAVLAKVEICELSPSALFNCKEELDEGQILSRKIGIPQFIKYCSSRGHPVPPKFACHCCLRHCSLNKNPSKTAVGTTNFFNQRKTKLKSNALGWELYEASEDHRSPNFLAGPWIV